jgi:hypothetical protein
MAVDILNVFNQDAFGVISLTNAVNDITTQYGFLNAMGIFTDEGIANKTVAVDYDPITNQLLPQSQWGGPGVANKTALSKSYAFNVPHFPVNDTILAADLQSRRRPGTDMVQDGQYALGKKMREMRVKLDQTLEWMKLGVLKSGIVKDGNGTTILDIYNTYGVSQGSASYVLGTSTTDVMGKIAATKRTILAALHGELMSGFVAFCSDGFYDAFVSHPNVQKAYQYFQNNNGQNLAGDYSFGSAVQSSPGLFAGINGFKFGGVIWINYSGSITDSTGSSQPIIDANNAYMLPLGTSVFKTFFSPADYMETVNTEGLPFYAKQRLMEFDKGIQVECQSNPLPLCLKPLVVQQVTT